MGFKDYFRQHGIGNNQTTTSKILAWDSKTKTPDVKPNEVFTGRKSANPDPNPKSIWNLFGKRKLERAQPPTVFHHGTAVTQAKLLSASPKKFTHNIDEDAFQHAIRDSKILFPGITTQQQANLAYMIGQVRERVPPNPILPKKLQGAEMMVLTQAISAVSKERPNGVDDVGRGLACLQNIDLVAAIRNPAAATHNAINTGNPQFTCPPYAIGGGMHTAATFDQDDLDCAWRLAQILGSTPTGFDLLQKITDVPAAPNVHASAAKHDREMLHVFLDGAREMREESGLARRPIVNDPRSLYAQVEGIVTVGNAGTPVPNPGQNGAVIPGVGNANLTVLQKGLLAVRDHIGQSGAHALSQGGRVAADEFNIMAAPNQQNGNSWAITFIRSGIYTDAAVDANGKPTRFALLNGRVEKMHTWAERAYADPEVGNWNKFKARAKRVFVSQEDKSPLRAYNRLGEGDNAIGFKNAAESSSMHEGRVIKETLIPILQRAIRASGADAGGGAAGPMAGGGQQLMNAAPPAVLHNAGGGQPTAREMTSVVRMAILDEILTNKWLTRFADGEPLDRFQLESVKDRIYAYFGGNRGNNGNLNVANQAALQGIIDANNIGYDPQVLVNWASDYAGPANIAAATATANTNKVNNAAPVPPTRHNVPDWIAFNYGINHVVNGVRDVWNGVLVDRATPNLNKTNPGAGQQAARITSAAGQFETQIAGQELGQTFKFTSGGAGGLGLGGLTYAATTIPTLGTVRAKLNLGSERVRRAVFEGGTLTPGHELFLGTETGYRTSVGPGASVGPGWGLGKGWMVGVTASGDLSYANENYNRRGPILRFRRILSGVNGDNEQTKRLARLTRKVMDDDLANAHPDGVAWVQPPNAHGGGAGTGDRASILKRVAQEWPDLSISWMGQSENTNRGGPSVGAGAGFYTEFLRLGAVSGSVGAQQGRTRKEWMENGGSLHVEKIERTDTFKVNTAVLGPLVAFSVGKFGLPGIGFGEFNGDVYRSQNTRRDSLIWEDGKINPRSYRTRTFNKQADFMAWALPQMADMAVDKARIYMAEKYHTEPKAGEAPVNLTTAQKQAREEENRILIETEFKVVLQHLEEQLANADLTQGVQIYYEYKQESVEAINLFKSLQKTALQTGDTEMAAHCEDRIEKLLRDDDSWMTSFLVDTDAVSVSRKAGINLLVKSQQEDTATFTRIRTFK